MERDDRDIPAAAPAAAPAPSISWVRRGGAGGAEGLGYYTPLQLWQVTGRVTDGGMGNGEWGMGEWDT